MLNWQNKKKKLFRKQEEFNERQRTSNKKLKRTRITDRGKVVSEYELWPSDRVILQRIANHMDVPISPAKIEQMLNKGEKITNRYGDVYSLVHITSTH